MNRQDAEQQLQNIVMESLTARSKDVVVAIIGCCDCSHVVLCIRLAIEEAIDAVNSCHEYISFLAYI